MTNIRVSLPELLSVTNIRVSLPVLVTSLAGIFTLGCGSGKEQRKGSQSGQVCRCEGDGGPGGRAAPGGHRGAAPGEGKEPAQGAAGVAAAGDASTRKGLLPKGQLLTLAEVTRTYRDHDSCVAAVYASLPPELTREADQANLAERVCQTRRALAERRPSLCEEIDDPFWPGACRRLYAVFHGRPGQCPVRRVRAQGRDALCIALATRDPLLCRAVRSEGGRRRCSAILGSAAGCRGMRTAAEVASCRADRLRWRAVLRPRKPRPGLRRHRPRYALSITEKGRTLRGASGALDRGVVVPRRAAKGRWLLGDLRPSGGRSRVEARLLLMADLPPPSKLPASLKVASGGRSARFCGLWRGRPVSPDRVTGQVKISRYGARRGARVTGSFAVTLSMGGQKVEVAGSFDTFVRDVVPGSWARRTCADRLAEVVPPRPTGADPRAVAAMGAAPEEHPCFFVAHWQGLRQVGYRVYGLRPRGACALLGLRDGDVVLSVGGRPMSRWADVTALYRRLSSAAGLTLRVERKGKRVTLKRAAH